MIVAMHQPGYFPWLGLLHKIARCDVFVVMDEVQLSDSLFQHRNQFLTTAGEVKYLSIPFVRKDYLERPLRDLAIADASWTRKHRDFLWNNYRKHPFAGEVMERLEAYYARPYSKLFDAVLESMRLSMGWFGLGAKIVLQSDLRYDRSLKRGDLVMALLEAVGATSYLSGQGARAYLDESRFCGGLSLRYDEFTHPTYPQGHAREFIPGLACLDVLFNVGPAAARNFLTPESTS
jgi:hypothetical protein